MTAQPGKKRMILGCDGTWLDRDDSLGLTGNIHPASNVSLLLRAVQPITPDQSIHQVVFYQSGVGSTGSWPDRVISGATAQGLSSNIREAYDWLGTNYVASAKDEIFLVGFSRGAFTARSIAGMIDKIGLLTNKGLPFLAEIFEDYEHRLDKDYKPSEADVPFPNKPSANDPAYAKELERLGMTTLDVPIKAIAVWDTVGALGIPRISWLEHIGLQAKEIQTYRFYDTTLFPCVQNAFQALALDERRDAFRPAVWEKPEGNKTNLHQSWFPGAHKNIGGGYPDMELSNITLAWMMDQLEPFLAFREGYILEQYELNILQYQKLKEETRPWSFGLIHDTSAGLYTLFGKTPRTPGRYHRVDPFTGEETQTRLRDTNEKIHPSVRSRLKLQGPGVADKGAYEAEALEGYDLVEGKEGWQWEFRKVDGAGDVLLESGIGKHERELLRMSRSTDEFVEGAKVD